MHPTFRQGSKQTWHFARPSLLGKVHILHAVTWQEVPPLTVPSLPRVRQIACWTEQTAKHFSDCQGAQMGILKGVDPRLPRVQLGAGGHRLYTAHQASATGVGRPVWGDDRRSHRRRWTADSVDSIPVCSERRAEPERPGQSLISPRNMNSPAQELQWGISHPGQLVRTGCVSVLITLHRAMHIPALGAIIG